MDDEETKKDDDELKGEVLLPEVDDELPVDEEDEDPLLHKHGKKVHEEGENPDEDSLDVLAELEEEELAEDKYDDYDPL